MTLPLAELDALVLRLRDVEHMTFAKIARRVKVNRKTVAEHYHALKGHRAPVRVRSSPKRTALLALAPFTIKEAERIGCSVSYIHTLCADGFLRRFHLYHQDTWAGSPTVIYLKAEWGVACLLRAPTQ